MIKPGDWVQVIRAHHCEPNDQMLGEIFQVRHVYGGGTACCGSCFQREGFPFFVDHPDFPITEEEDHLIPGPWVVKIEPLPPELMKLERELEHS